MLPEGGDSGRCEQCVFVVQTHIVHTVHCARASEQVAHHKGRSEPDGGEDGQEVEREAVKMLTDLECESVVQTANIV